MNDLLVHHHLGLGDHFVCNGLVNHLAEQYDTIYVPSKRQYYETVRCLYSDEPKIRVFIVDDEFRDVEHLRRAVNCPILRVGFERCDRRRFDVSFYDQLRISFELRYAKFRLPRQLPQEDDVYAALAPNGDYCLVHNEGSRGTYTLKVNTDLPVVYITKERVRQGEPFRNLLNYRKLIENAAEIHCINSSVIHLVDSLDPRASLFFHPVPKVNFSIRERWTTVQYRVPWVRNVLARAHRLRDELGVSRPGWISSSPGR